MSPESTAAFSPGELLPRKSLVVQLSVIYAMLTLVNLLVFWTVTGANQVRLIAENSAHTAESSSLEILRRFDAALTQRVPAGTREETELAALARVALEAGGKTAPERYLIVDDRRRVLARHPDSFDFRPDGEFELNLFRALQMRDMKYQPFYAAPDIYNFKLAVFIPLPGGTNAVLYHEMPVDSLREEFFRLLRIALGMVVFLLAAQTFFGYLIYRKLVSPVVSVSRAAQSMASGDFGVIERVPKSRNELRTLVTSFNFMAGEIRNKQRAVENALDKLSEKDRRATYELEIAQKIQSALLPGKFDFGHVRASFIYRPLSMVSGDYYDVLPLTDGSVAVFIGDASGHGVPAAFLTMFAKVFFGALVDKIRDPAELLGEMNRLLSGLIDGHGLYLTAFFARIYPDGNAEFCNCMHPEPIVLRRDGELTTFESRGFFLGLMPEPAFPLQTQRFRFAAGDKLLLYTDGITEAQGCARSAEDRKSVSPTTEAHGADDMFGAERLKQSAGAGAHLDAAALVRKIYDDVAAYAGGENFNDDVTILAVEIASCKNTAVIAREEYRRANELMKTNRPMEALTILAGLERSGFSAPKIALKTGICQLKAGQHQIAADTFVRLLAELPENATARAWLAVARFRSGDRPEAERQIDEALRREPENATLARLKKQLTS